MNRMHTLVPYVISMKDLLSTVKSLQEMIASQPGAGGESPVEYLKKWLNAGVA